MYNSTSNFLFPQDHPLTKRCSKGDLCLHPAGTNSDLSLSEFALNRCSKDGHKASCRFCDAFNDHWRRVCPELSREDALNEFLELRSKLAVVLPDGYKLCSFGDKCIHESGSLQPVENFYARHERKSGNKSECSDCVKFRQWCRNCKLDRDDPASLIKYRSLRIKDEPKKSDLPDGMRRCSRGENCACQLGSIQHESEFNKHRNKKYPNKNDGYSYVCNTCERFNRWRIRTSVDLSLSDAVKEYKRLYQPPDGCKVCSRQDDCIHPSGPVLELSFYTSDKATPDGLSPCCIECERFSGWWAKNQHFDRNEARVKYIEHREIRNYVPPTGYKLCGSEVGCIAKNGPELPVDRFSLNVWAKDSLNSACMDCQRYKAWRYQNNLQHSDETLSLYQQFRELIDYVAPPGFKRCARMEKCLNNDGPLQKIDNFRTSKFTFDGLHPHCKMCQSAYSAVRRHSQRALVNDFRITDIEYMLEWFDHCCCYCKESITDGHENDHFIPVKRGGGTTPDNMIPACQGCNSSKRAKEPISWVLSKFGEDQGRMILARIQEFFDTVRIVE